MALQRQNLIQRCVSISLSAILIGLSTASALQMTDSDALKTLPTFQRVPVIESPFMIPVEEFERIEKGIDQRARAQGEILRLLYSKDTTEAEREELFRKIPLLRPAAEGEAPRFLDLNAGFAMELMGKLHPA